MNTILIEIFKDLVFTEKESLLILSKLKKVTLKKKSFLLKPNKEVNSFHFIQKGCLRTYFLDANGKEHTIQFGIKGWWISDYIALFAKVKTQSLSYIECLKDATLYTISKKDFDKLCQAIPKLSQFYKTNLESAVAFFNKRILEKSTLSARDQYIKFVSTHPNIEKVVKNYHVASYLGITTESLSRIRKEIALL